MLAYCGSFQMGSFVVIPICFFLLVTYLAWHLNAIRIHRIYVNKKDQKVFAAVISRFGLFTRKVRWIFHCL